MRRLALICALIAAAVAGVVTTAASGDDTRTYYIELDNAFGLVTGSPVKVAGVEAGSVTDFFINSDKRAVAKVELSGPVAVLGEQSVCSTEPQSLIAEYFIDCNPKGDPIQTTDESDDEHADDPDIPVDQTRQTVQNDLVLSALRMPFRERLTLLLNEFGTALAGNGDNLNEAIRRGAPALEETRKVFDLLASQNTIIRDLNVNSDRIIGRLAARRKDVVDFINETKDTAAASAARRDDLSQNFALLDDFLAELRPTMTRLNALAVQGTPLARDLRAAAPGLTTLSKRLPKFNPNATDALVSLGKAAVVGQRALNKSRDEVKALNRASRKSFPVSDNLAKFLLDIDDPRRAVETDTRANSDTGRKGTTGYTGMEGLLNYLYYQTGAINQYDEIGHLLHFSIFEVGTGPCSNYNAGQFDPDGPGPKDATPGVPNRDASGSTTDVLQANRCVAWLGKNQPGISQAVDVPPYDPSVCPEGSTDPALCNPAGTPTAAAAKKRAPQAGGSGGDGLGSPAGQGGPGGQGGSSGQGGSGDAGSTAPGADNQQPAPAGDGQGSTGDGAAGLGGVGEVPGAPAAPQAAPRSSAGSSANGDLLGYLFGS